MIPPLSRLVPQLGILYAVLLPLSAVVASWLVTRLARRTTPGQSHGLYGVTILLPLWVGVIGTISGIYWILSRMDLYSDKSSRLLLSDLQLVGVALMTTWVGLLLVAVPFCAAWVVDGRRNRSAARPEQGNAADSR